MARVTTKAPYNVRFDASQDSDTGITAVTYNNDANAEINNDGSPSTRSADAAAQLAVSCKRRNTRVTTDTSNLSRSSPTAHSVQAPSPFLAFWENVDHGLRLLA